MFPSLYRISKDHWNQTIVTLVYNVLKTLMEMNTKLFDELSTNYKNERQRYFLFYSLHYELLCTSREKKKEKDREELWKRLEVLDIKAIVDKVDHGG